MEHKSIKRVEGGLRDNIKRFHERKETSSIFLSRESDAKVKEKHKLFIILIRINMTSVKN